MIAAAALVSLAGVAAASSREGWHGETMPEGLDRAENHGEYRWAKDGSIMVWVPPGPFTMGSDDGAPNEQPVRQVVLDGFYIDKHEVSWGQWKASGLPYRDERQTRRPAPGAPDWGIVDDQPVLNVTWHDARTYLEQMGKRLPTEAEWEKAARGTDGRIYPWGDEPPTFDRAVWKQHPIAGTSTAPVDCCVAGASPYGALNMAGNAYEWCEDVYDRGFYARAPAENPVHRGEGRYRVLRGGAFVLEASELRAAGRYRLLPIDRTPYIGFRGAVSGALP